MKTFEFDDGKGNRYIPMPREVATLPVGPSLNLGGEEDLLKSLAARVNTPAAAIERIAEQLIAIGYIDMMKIDADLKRLSDGLEFLTPGSFAALLSKWAQEIKGGNSERSKAEGDR